MVDVHLWSSLRRLADGQEIVSVEAATVGDMLSELVRLHPGLAEAVQTGVSVAVDGRIIASSRSEPLPPDSEIYLLQRLKGG